MDAFRCVNTLPGRLLVTSSSSASIRSDKCFRDESSLSFLNVSVLPSFLGEIGTAGFGAELEQSLPILVGGFKPDGFGKDDGLAESGFVAVVVLTDDRFSEDAEDAGAGGAGVADVTSDDASCTSLIFNSLLKTLYNFFFQVFSLGTHNFTENRFCC